MLENYQLTNFGKSTKKKFLIQNNLNQGFFYETREFKEYLNRIKNKFDDFDQNKPSEEEQIKFIEKNKVEIFETLTDHFNIVWDIVKNFSRKEYLIYQKIYQKELHPFLKTSPLNKRIYEKPLGYAGDFITVNYFYENGYPGNSTYEKLISRYTLSIPITQAHINRRKFFKNLILETIEKKKEEKDIRISSFACGSALEFLDILRENEIQSNLTFVGIDSEVLAIQYAMQKVEEISKNRKRKFNVHLLCENILGLIRKRKVPEVLLNQDLIYCSGFLDYLRDSTASRTIEYLFNLLNNNGILVLVNVSDENPLRPYYEMLGEWYLRYRNPGQMLSLSKQISNVKETYIDFEPETRMNLFLTLKK
jgi:extracellular factor (EF) 3-hydroxypalmitic acid methyl ester biosynthesis protein